MLVTTLWSDYVLFAVVRPDTPRRRVLKYSYGDEFDPGLDADATFRDRVARLVYRDAREFVIPCPAAWRARSFHMEIAIPEELRVRSALLVDFDEPVLLSAEDTNVNRASLYADLPLSPQQDAHAYVEVCPERAGFSTRAAVIAVAVCGMLFAGVASDLDISSPGRVISLVLAGAALFSGLTAESGEHRLVRTVFRANRVWRGWVAAAALVASVCLTLGIPSEQPVCVWVVAAVVSAVAAARLAWSWARAAG